MGKFREKLADLFTSKEEKAQRERSKRLQEETDRLMALMDKDIAAMKETNKWLDEYITRNHIPPLSESLKELMKMHEDTTTDDNIRETIAMQKDLDRLFKEER